MPTNTHASRRTVLRALGVAAGTGVAAGVAGTADATCTYAEEGGTIYDDCPFGGNAIGTVPEPTTTGCLTDSCVSFDGATYHFVEWDAGVDAPDGYVHEDFLLVRQDPE